MTDDSILDNRLKAIETRLYDIQETLATYSDTINAISEQVGPSLAALENSPIFKMIAGKMK